MVLDCEAGLFWLDVISCFFLFLEERNCEDHEHVLAILSTWAPGSNNKLLFRKDNKKYHFFAHTSVSYCS